MFSLLFRSVLFAYSVDGLKILCIFSYASYSHHAIGYSLAKELAIRGHRVTFITPYQEEESIENLRMIVMTGYVEMWIGRLTELTKDVNPFSYHNKSAITNIALLGSMGSITVEKTLSDEKVQKLLRSSERFDVAVLEVFGSEGLLAIAHHFGVPSVLVSTIGPSVWTNHLVGNPDIPSYMNSWYLEPPVHRSFWKRTLNFLIYVFQKLHDHFYLFPKQNRIVRKYLPNSPCISDMISNTSLLLLNSDSPLSLAVPMVPNMVEIGGIHIGPSKELPGDLQIILDNAKDGVVYFSMGSILKSKDMPPSLLEDVLRALSKLKEIVLWKFEVDLPGKPSNVIIRKWFPQADVLAHPNVKLFITHGGLLSILEAAHRGVPILGIPVFGDQRMNVLSAVNRGHAFMMDYSDLSDENLSKALDEILHNPQYAKNAKSLSEIVNDKLVKQGDKAVFWIEYIVRHKGAKHLRSAALELAWYQHASFDVILFLTFLIVVLFFIFYKIIRWLLCKRIPVKQKIH